MSSTRNIDIGEKEYSNLSVRAWEPNKGAFADGSLYYQVDDTVHIAHLHADDLDYYNRLYRCVTAHNSGATFHESIDPTNHWEEISPQYKLAPGTGHPPVTIALSSNENIAAFSAPSNVKDGQTLTAGTSRILLTGQTDQSQNGIWVYEGNGVALTRPSDFISTGDHIIGEQVICSNGSNAGFLFHIDWTSNTDDVTVDVDTDNHTWGSNAGGGDAEDTGWIACADSHSKWDQNSVQVRRIGRQVFMRGRMRRINLGITGNEACLRIPNGYEPAVSFRTLSIRHRSYSGTQLLPPMSTLIHNNRYIYAIRDTSAGGQNGIVQNTYCYFESITWFVE